MWSAGESPNRNGCQPLGHHRWRDPVREVSQRIAGEFKLFVLQEVQQGNVALIHGFTGRLQFR